MTSLSIILPAKNEATSLSSLLPELKERYPESEIIVVNDGSTDDTRELCKELEIKSINHPYSMGNGAAIKSGTREATGEVLVFMDADGQHQPKDIEKLLSKLDQGYDMVVGARSSKGQASMGRWFANSFYNKLSSWMVNQPIKDLTSGFRVVKAEKFKEFLYLLPNGFSYPTTSTMAFFRAGYAVAYESIEVLQREGKSHISLFRDGVRFLLIIFKIGSLYSPLKLFLPISLAHAVIGVSYYLYTFITVSRFTNMSALLLTTAIVIFLIGLISEQITMLMYQNRERK